jgi:serine/threonine protein kinase
MTLESGQVLAARYALLRRLGDGRAAEVWLARDRESRTDRVLKILRPELHAVADERRRFLHGAALQREIEHPNVLRCTDVRDGEIVFAVFGDDAIADLTRLRGAALDRIVPALERVAAALEAVHARGLVHGDVKCANVLLADDGRPMLTDFGTAARLGEPAVPRGGSPYSSSPQQLAGAAPSIADDAYGFGALTYELVTGYPPFYPDAVAATQSDSPPSWPASRTDVPAELRRLVMDCLARSPDARPANLKAVRAALLGLQVRSSPPGLTPRVEPPLKLSVPETPPPAIEPSWTRPGSTGPSPQELRSQGFRRGLVAAALVFLLFAAGLVFFALPQWVERKQATAPRAQEPAPATPSPTPSPGGESRDLARAAESKRQFEELRPAVAERLAALEKRSAGSWAGEPFARGKQALVDADAASGRREYERALGLLQSADRDVRAVEQAWPGRLREALAAGSAALLAGNGDEARRQFDLAAKIDPANAAAKRGLERVATLDEVQGLLAKAAELERTGQSAAAQAAYRKALQLDPDTSAAREALARIETRATSEAFNAAVAEGLAAASRKDYVAARAAYERAGRIRPGAPEVREGLEQVERALGDRSIDAHLEAARRAEREERWSDALVEFRQALKIDANLLPAQQGVERAEPRAMLDAELDAYLEKPEKVFSSEVRGAARAAIAKARTVPDPGPALQRKTRELEQLVAAAETPVRVAIASDNRTEVTIYRVGRLGAFERKDMELLPGRYTVVGTRNGFRDVRRELTVVPGREPPALVIRCEEQI